MSNLCSYPRLQWHRCVVLSNFTTPFPHLVLDVSSHQLHAATLTSTGHHLSQPQATVTIPKPSILQNHSCAHASTKQTGDCALLSPVNRAASARVGDYSLYIQQLTRNDARGFQIPKRLTLQTALAARNSESWLTSDQSLRHGQANQVSYTRDMCRRQLRLHLADRNNHSKF